MNYKKAIESVKQFLSYTTYRQNMKNNDFGTLCTINPELYSMSQKMVQVEMHHFN